MLVELGLVEQRLAAVSEVLNEGVSVSEAARRAGVTRQSVHRWLRRYGSEGLKGLADRSSVPDSCPHQMPPEVEALVVSMRREHPGWGPETLLFRLEDAGVDPLPGRSSVYRCLVRHGLVEVNRRRRRRSDCKRWERARPMELWQVLVSTGTPAQRRGNEQGEFFTSRNAIAAAKFSYVRAALSPMRLFFDNYSKSDCLFGLSGGLKRYPSPRQHLVGSNSVRLSCSSCAWRRRLGLGRCDSARRIPPWR